MIERKLLVDPEKERQYYFPINTNQVEDLLGKVLTQLEVMNLRNEKATKDVFRQLLWQWYGTVQENSLRSYQNCLAPIFSYSEDGRVLKDGPQTNRWGYSCPNGCDWYNGAACSSCPPDPDTWLEFEADREQEKEMREVYKQYKAGKLTLT